MGLDLTPQIRKTLYTVFAIVGIALGAVQIGFASADAGNPVWLKVSLAVYAFIIGPAGLGLAASKVTPTP